MTYSFQIWWKIPHPGHPVHASHPGHHGHLGYPVLVALSVLQVRVYHRFGIFSTVSGNSVLAWLFQLWKGASYRIFWKCHKNQMLSRFHQLGEDQMRSHGRAPVAAWHEHQQEEELEDQDGGWWGTWSWVRPDCWVHRARSWAGELLEIKASRQRNQTVKKGKAVLKLLLDQVDSLKKGFEGFDKEGAGTITQTTMQVRPLSRYLYSKITSWLTWAK